MKTSRSAYARAAVIHERAARLHDQVAEAALRTGDLGRADAARVIAEKERVAARKAREREAAAVAAIVSLGL
jgi:hypothetical protein